MIKKDEVTASINDVEGIPIYNVPVTGGDMVQFDGMPELIIGKIDLPAYHECIAFLPVVGDSMYPRYKSGDLIGIIPVIDGSIIQWGNPYVIITNDEQRMLKYIRRNLTNSESVILRSENDKFDDIDMPASKIKKLYRVKGPVRNE